MLALRIAYTMGRALGWRTVYMYKLNANSASSKQGYNLPLTSSPVIDKLWCTRFLTHTAISTHALTIRMTKQP